MRHSLGDVSLRAKLLALFAILALAPLVGLGVFDYARSKGAVERLIADQTTLIAERLAAQLSQRFEIVEGDLQLLARNEETMRLLAARRSGDANAVTRATDSARTFFADAWRVLGESYDWVELRDGSGVPLLRSERPAAEFGREPRTRASAESSIPITVAVSTGDSPTGTLAAAVRVDALVPTAVMDTRFGRAGYTEIALQDGHVIHESGQRQPVHVVPRTGASATIRYTERDTLRVASVLPVKGVPLLIQSSGAVAEFAPSLAKISAVNLAFAVAVAVLLGVVFVVVTRRMTRPLETLTTAAVQVGHGNFSPVLPPAGRDEVGRLAEAFSVMSTHIDRMVAELERSQQMAAVGAFARQISHEIRNPLTSIKLNLQGLERDARDGVVSADNQRMVEICLEEINRLDRVVRGVLTLGRPTTSERREVALSALVNRAIDVVMPQLRQQGVRVSVSGADDSSRVCGDEEQLVAMLLNVFLNAAEAMPAGGSLSVSIEAAVENGAGPMARVRVSDTGPGVPAEARERVFDPFFTTKRDGSGLGLAVALRDAERHGGKLTLSDSSEAGGATFVIDLPLAAERV